MKNLFRAKMTKFEISKWIDCQDFITGDFLRIKNKTYIVVEDSYSDSGVRKMEVLPKTVGKFSGIVDKNGVKIFEGDVVKHGKSTAYVKFYRDCFYIFYSPIKKVKLENVKPQEIEVKRNIYDKYRYVRTGKNLFVKICDFSAFKGRILFAILRFFGVKNPITGF